MWLELHHPILHQLIPMAMHHQTLLQIIQLELQPILHQMITMRLLHQTLLQIIQLELHPSLHQMIPMAMHHPQIIPLGLHHPALLQIILLELHHPKIIPLGLHHPALLQIIPLVLQLIMVQRFFPITRHQLSTINLSLLRPLIALELTIRVNMILCFQNMRSTWLQWTFGATRFLKTNFASTTPTGLDLKCILQ